MIEDKPDRIALVGYSLGGSVALAAAAKNPGFAAVVEFAGSLPPQLSRLCTLRDLVCDVQLYPKEGHTLSNGARIKATRELESFLKEHVAFGALP